jgi:hypothetical protein
VSFLFLTSLFHAIHFFWEFDVFCCALQFLVANISHTEGRDATNKAEFRSPKSVMSMAGMPGMAAKADEPSMQEKDWSGTKDHVNFTLLPQLVSRQEVAKILALMNGKEDNIDTATACLASFNYEQGRTLANVELDDEGDVTVYDVNRGDLADAGESSLSSSPTREMPAPSMINSDLEDGNSAAKDQEEEDQDDDENGDDIYTKSRPNNRMILDMDPDTVDGTPTFEM